MSKRAWMVIVATAVLVVGVVGPASAVKTFHSEVVITDYETTDDGNLIVYDEVASHFKKCRKHRTVLLKWEKPSGGNKTVGEDIIDTHGKSKIFVEDAKNGIYFERLKAKDIDEGECERAKSQDILVDFGA